MKKQYKDKYEIDSLKHLELASVSGCSIFLTTNEEIIKDRKELEKKYNITIRKPSEVCTNIPSKGENPLIKISKKLNRKL